ncbi:MAG TPA: histidine--tRNA ligase [Euryarchaeota archaeon]|nr:histidine--tRNA ligase [Euryarchaeota archaeon]
MFKRPRGTRDLLPDEMAARRAVESVLRQTFESFGYGEIQTPTFENLELITAKSGVEITGHLYDFTDKSDRNLALRPELSAPTVRLYVNELRTRPKPRKLYYFENCFRYERPQKGRYREFWQAGVEQIGSARPEAEAEALALAVACLERLELKDFRLSIGHLGILRSLLASHGLDDQGQNQVIGMLDRGDEEGLLGLSLPPGAREDLTAVIGLKGEGAAVLSKAREVIGTRCGDVLDSFDAVLSLLRGFGVKEPVVDLGIARGLDYYTGMVFEIRAEGLGAQDQICGGGTYSLVKVFGGGDVPSCGFGFGFDRLMLALESQGRLPASALGPRVFVVPESRKMLNRAIEIISDLRKEVSCELELMGRKLGKALSYANTEGIPYVLIVSEDTEDEEGYKLILRDMSSGEQKTIDYREVADEVG